jgi:RNA polymerase sigma-70 factor (ECF subfamily)
MTAEDRRAPAPVLGETTERLVGRASSGDREAFEALLARYIPRLRRFAHGRLPALARDLVDTDDLVQVTLGRVVRQVGSFEDRGRGAFHAYLRQSLLNELRNQVRRARRHPAPAELSEQERDRSPSPLDAAVGQETLERYEAALLRLDPDEREAVIGRVELGLSHAELAEALGKASPDAARMAVARALVRLTREMCR